jgi:hypothetical protein
MDEVPSEAYPDHRSLLYSSRPGGDSGSDDEACRELYREVALAGLTELLDNPEIGESCGRLHPFQAFGRLQAYRRERPCVRFVVSPSAPSRPGSSREVFAISMTMTEPARCEEVRSRALYFSHVRNGSHVVAAMCSLFRSILTALSPLSRVDIPLRR